MKTTKVAICKSLGQIPNHVTALISKQFSESWSDDSSCAKLGKCILQKAEADLEPHHAPKFQLLSTISKKPGQILNHVTALISEQFSESCSDNLPCAKLGKHILQNAKAVLYCIVWYFFYCMVLCCSVGYCMVMHGNVWYFTVLYGSTRSFMALLYGV